MQYRFNKLRHMARICAWTKRIEHGGEWIAFEEYLHRRFGFETSHGMSEEAAKAMEHDSFS